MAVQLFAGDNYYPAGGWDDYIDSFPSVDAAVAHLESSRREKVTPPEVITHTRMAWIQGCTGFNLHEEIAAVQVGATWGGGTVTAIDGDNVTITFPERTDVYYHHDWGHVVQDGQIVHRWSPA